MLFSNSHASGLVLFLNDLCVCVFYFYLFYFMGAEQAAVLTHHRRHSNDGCSSLSRLHGATCV